jgi:hypothetical protein
VEVQELKRWMADLRIWGTLLLVNAIAVFGFWKIQTQTWPAEVMQAGYQLAEDMIDAYHQTESVDLLMAEYTDYAYSEQGEKKIAYNLFYDTISRYEKYKDYLDNINKNVNVALLIGGLGEENEYYGKNISKTEQDFSGMEQIYWLPSLTKSAEEVLQNRLIDMGLLAFVIFMVMIFMMDQKNGMYKLQRCCKNGRVVSAVHCFIALLLWIVIGTVSLYVNTYMTSTYLFGQTDLSMPVQAMKDHQGVNFQVNIWQYALGMMGVKMLTMFAFGISFWLCCLLVKKELAAILLFGLAAGGEWILYTRISYQSKWEKLKIWNLWAGGYRDDLLKNYQNINLSDHAVSSKMAFCGFLVIVLLVELFFLLLIYGKGYLAEVEGRSAGKSLFSKIWILNGGIGLEQIKIWFVQKNIILVALFLMLLLTQNTVGALGFDQTAAYKMSFYDQLDGLEIDAQQELLKTEAENVEQQKQDYITRKETAENWQQEALSEAIRSCETQKNVIETLQEELTRIVSRKAEGRNVRMLSDLGYQMLLTVDGISLRQQYSFYLLALLVLFTAGSMAYENQRGMDRLIHTTEKRRGQLFLRKMAAYLPWGGIAILLVSLKEIADIKKQFGLDGMGYDVQSLKLFDGVRVHMTIWQLILLLILARIAVGLMIMCVMMWISDRFKKTGLAIAAETALFIVPAFFALTGYYGIRMISLSWYLDVIRWIIPLLQ